MKNFVLKETHFVSERTHPLSLSSRLLAESFPALPRAGLHLGDEFCLSPLQGKRQYFRLNRTKIDFLSGRPLHQASSFHVALPNLMNDDLHFVLELCQNDPDELPQEECFFILQTLNERPFLLNGNFCYFAVIERGDKVVMGHNILHFGISQKNQLENHGSYLKENQSIVSSDLNVLIEGESGTGKTWLAKQIHEKSGRTGPFIHLNLSSFSPSLLESELFGHEKGSFTGAIISKKGAFLEAQDGTLFLDEVDSLPLDIQTKLLLFLDDKMVRPVGGNSSRKCNTRLIFASGRSLVQLVQEGRVRRDFYFRLTSGSTTRLPSLREDPKRIIELCHMYCAQNDVFLEPDLLDYYAARPWPGNVRQLYSHLNKKKVCTKGRKLQFDHLDEQLCLELEGYLQEMANREGIISLKELKEQYAARTYYKLHRNLNLTAHALKVNINTLRSMLRKAQVLEGPQLVMMSTM